MNTPLQKAAQALIDNWDYPTISEYIEELRKALDDELAQSVEPVAFMRPSIEGYDSSYRDANVVVMSKASGATHWDESGWVPLYLHPPQPQATAQKLTIDESRSAFEKYWLETRGAKKANRELQRHHKQPQTYCENSANRHWTTWQAAQGEKP